jgi:2-dehydro-3-deoxyphosphooctonate aldolase (KDO 8-P synthase)
MSALYQTIKQRSDVFFLIAGPCVIESELHALKMAEAISAVAKKLDLPYVFKA